MCHSNVNGITHTHTQTHTPAYTQKALQSVNHEGRNTSEQGRAVAGPGRLFESYFRVVQRDLHPGSCGFMPENELGDSCARQICAFGSEHNYVSEPSERGGKMHTRTQTHTFLHTHSQSPSFYKNKANIRCCLFSMFYC